ncbi:MAG: DUF2325 domain-containing protein [Deltaproteobacteria bacterium]|nr:DUF2325 domain-containing protein [Deltaproteobacteria bacterium]
MSILVIGGMDRLERHYFREARDMGASLKIFTKLRKNIHKKIGKVDAIVIFTGKVSHSLKHKIISYAHSNGIPVFTYHNCGLCTLRRCLDYLKKQIPNGGLK